MKKIIAVFVMIGLLSVPFTASASETIDAADPMSMESWQGYAASFGFETDGGYDTKESVRQEILDDFNCGGLYDQLQESWSLEGGESQIFGFRFADSDSGGTMLKTVEELYQEWERTVIGRTEEESHIFVKMAPGSEDSPWYLGLLQYDTDLIIAEFCDEEGEEILDEMVGEALLAADEENDAEEDGAVYSELVDQAVQVLCDAWNDIYWEEDYPDKEYLLDIRSTRIICIRDTLEEKQEEFFGDMEYVIEFLLYSDYMAAGENTSGLNVGYYDCIGMNDNVVVYKDGHMECQSRVLSNYRSRTYETDYSTFIDRVIDLHEQYNQEIHFKGHQVTD